jgi:hypothetical protein
LFPVDFHFSGYHPDKKGTANKWVHTVIAKQNNSANNSAPVVVRAPAPSIA